jgi:hypothetical protein
MRNHACGDRGDLAPAPPPERQLAVSAQIHRELRPWRILPRDDMLRERILEPALNRALQWTGAVLRIPTGLREEVFRRRGELDADLPFREPRGKATELNRLTVTGRRETEKTDKTDTYYTHERTYGSFTRSFTLPDGINTAAIHADLRDGVLSILLPKKPESQPKSIPIVNPAEAKKA